MAAQPNELDAEPGNTVMPYPAAGKAKDLRTSLVLTADWVATEVVSVRLARRLTLLIAYDADGSGTNNRCQITAWGACEDGTANGASPAIASVDKWYAPAVIDAVATDAVLTGTKVTNFTPSLTPEYRNYAIGPASFTTIAADNGTDKIRVALSLDVTPFRWFHIQCRELGDTDAGDLGVLGVKYVLSL